MRAAVFEGEGRIGVAERALPPPLPGEVRLRVKRCALCGSDLRLFRRGADWTPGHEIAGVVDQPGHRLHGARALAYIVVFCGECAMCRAGETHLCEREAPLIGWNRPGGYAEAVNVPERCLLPVPADVSDSLAPLLLDTIGTAAHAIRLARQVLKAPAPVLVLGAGPIGLGAVLAAQALGFPEVEVAEPRARRLEAAVALGACAFDGAGTRRFGLVLESSGRAEARQTGVEAVRPHGVAVLLGESDTPWPFTETRSLRRNDFWMLRSFYFPIGDFAANLELLRARREDYAGLVDQECDLDGLGATFAAFAEGTLLKPMLAP